ncbi:MAG: acyltransferase [Butyrivibrio sp.]|nr:acyltransferase [Butyrivibrio sp.]
MKKRVEWIDIARGIGIIMAMLIHSCTSVIRNQDYGVNLFYAFTSTSSMPLMIFLSGCSVKLNSKRYMEMSLKDFAKKKLLSFMLPYFSYSAIVYIIFVITNFLPFTGPMMKNLGYGNISFLRFLIGLIIGNNHFSIHVWFLYVLFIYEMIAYLIFKYVKRDYVFIIISVAAYFIEINVDTSISMAWMSGLLYFMFFTLGIYMYRKRINKWVGIACFFLWMIAYGIYAFMGLNDFYRNYILALAIPLFAITSISWYGQMKKKKSPVQLRWLGRKSMSLYLFQQPFFGSALGTILYKVVGFPAWPSVIICIIASFVLPLVIRAILVRYRICRVLFNIR